MLLLHSIPEKFALLNFDILLRLKAFACTRIILQFSKVLITTIAMFCLIDNLIQVLYNTCNFNT